MIVVLQTNTYHYLKNFLKSNSEYFFGRLVTYLYNKLNSLYYSYMTRFLSLRYFYQRYMRSSRLKLSLKNVGFYVFSILLSGLGSCATKKVTNSKKYVSVTEFGAKANGIHDDRKNIQLAFENADTVFFPAGTYLLGSKTLDHSLLYIDERYQVRALIFDTAAILKVSSEIPRNYHKPATLQVRARYKNLKSFYISGLHIDGNFEGHQLDNSGLLIYSNKGKRVDKITLRDITIKNVGKTGIHTEAKHSDLKDITTSNCGGHGIGIINTRNPNQITEFYLENYKSSNDKAYSIDFSGKEIPHQRSTLLWNEKYIGRVKNVVSLNSGLGIKTAGCWSLNLSNTQIINPRHNGFCVNKDSPQDTIFLDNIKIINPKNAGLNLSKKANIIAKNISITGYKTGIIIGEADFSVDGLFLDGQHKNNACIRLGNSKVLLQNFEIVNNNSLDNYPIWVSGKKVVMKNGTIENNNSPYGLKIHETTNEVKIDNLTIGGLKMLVAVVNDQLKGSTQIINSDFSLVKGKKIIDKYQTTRTQNVIGVVNTKEK